MFLEKRPTSVTVIGWVWAVLGAASCVNAVVLVLMMLNNSELRNVMGNLSFIPYVQFAVGCLAVVAGIGFLRLKAWSRPVLETLTWLLLLWLVGFTLYMFITIIFVEKQSSGSNKLFLPFMGLFCAVIYGVPLGAMLKALRGPRVKAAIAGIDDQLPS